MNQREITSVLDQAAFLTKRPASPSEETLDRWRLIRAEGASW